jgi:hypothetical protein
MTNSAYAKNNGDGRCIVFCGPELVLTHAHKVENRRS